MKSRTTYMYSLEFCKTWWYVRTTCNVLYVLMLLCLGCGYNSQSCKEVVPVVLLYWEVSSSEVDIHHGQQVL